MPSVTVYTKDTCAPCKMVKVWLKNKGITYTEKDVNDPTNLQESVAKSGYSMVPIIEVGDQIIAGPNFSLLSKLLLV